MVELNKIYNEDNLELMKKIENESVDLIYCDILYNTGRKFKDFEDNLGSPQEAIKWYRPRLEEMLRILKKTGSIYLHMDHRLSHYIKVEMDKIFGLENFRNEITWRRDASGKGAKGKSKDWSNVDDKILFYTKTNQYFFEKQYTSVGHKQIKEYRYQDEDGRFFKRTSLGDYSEQTIGKLEQSGLIYTSKTGKKYKKYYLEDAKLAIDNVWVDIYGFGVRTSSKERCGYDTQKPKDLMERIIKASSKEGDTVADFFCGSGTTIVAAKELNRKYIGCDINKRAVGITNARLIQLNNLSVGD